MSKSSRRCNEIFPPASRSHNDAPSLSWRSYNVLGELLPLDVDHEMLPLLHTDYDMIFPLHDVDEMIPHDVDDEMGKSINQSRGFYAAFPILHNGVCDEKLLLSFEANAMFYQDQGWKCKLLAKNEELLCDKFLFSISSSANCFNFC